MQEDSLLLKVQPKKPKRIPLLRWNLKGCKYSSLALESVEATIYFNLTSQLYGIMVDFRHRDQTHNPLYSDVGLSDPRGVLENTIAAMINNLKREHGGYVTFENVAKEKTKIPIPFNLTLAQNLASQQAV